MGKEKLLERLIGLVLTTHFQRVDAGTMPLGLFTINDDPQAPADAPRNTVQDWLTSPFASYEHKRTGNTAQYTAHCVGRSLGITARPLVEYLLGRRSDTLPPAAYDLIDELGNGVHKPLPETPADKPLRVTQTQAQNQLRAEAHIRATHAAVVRGIDATVRSTIGYVARTQNGKTHDIKDLAELPVFFWQECRVEQEKLQLYASIGGTYILDEAGFLPDARLPVGPLMLQETVVPHVTTAYTAAKQKFGK